MRELKNSRRQNWNWTNPNRFASETNTITLLVAVF